MVLSAFQQNAFRSEGFLLIDEVVPVAALPPLGAEVDRLLGESPGRGGVRNVLRKSARLRELATSGAPSGIARALLGPSARPTKLTIFDKSRRANWKVPWHQDLTIAVSERRELDGYGPWSLKDGIVHVQAPASLLEHVVALRLHLDDTPPENGALRVLPGSHQLGRIGDDDILSLRRRIPERTCPVPAAGGMLMSPLLLHASSPSSTPSRRRVLHFEYSAASLPEGLDWA